MHRICVVLLLTLPLFGQAAPQVTTARHLINITDKHGDPVVSKMEDIRVNVDGTAASIVSLEALKDRPLAVAVVVDYSGAMAGREELLQKVTQNVLESFKQYNATTFLCLYSAHVICNSVERGKAELLAQLPKLHPSGRPDLAKALNNAANLLERAGTTADIAPTRLIVIITNGDTTDEPGMLSEAVENLHSNVSIFPIGLLDIGAAEERKNLLALASATEGHAIFTDDPETLPKLMKKALDSEYQLVFTVPGHPSTSKVKIETPTKDWQIEDFAP